MARSCRGSSAGPSSLFVDGVGSASTSGRSTSVPWQTHAANDDDAGRRSLSAATRVCESNSSSAGASCTYLRSALAPNPSPSQLAWPPSAHQRPSSGRQRAIRGPRRACGAAFSIRRFATKGARSPKAFRRPSNVAQAGRYLDKQ